MYDVIFVETRLQYKDISRDIQLGNFRDTTGFACSNCRWPPKRLSVAQQGSLTGLWAEGANHGHRGARAQCATGHGNATTTGYTIRQLFTAQRPWRLLHAFGGGGSSSGQQGRACARPNLCMRSTQGDEQPRKVSNRH